MARASTCTGTFQPHNTSAANLFNRMELLIAPLLETGQPLAGTRSVRQHMPPLTGVLDREMHRRHYQQPQHELAGDARPDTGQM